MIITGGYNVYPKDMNQLPSPDSLKTFLKENIANYKLPKKMEFIAQLPRNSMGKIQKNILRQQYTSLYK